MMVGRLLSYWEGISSGAMLNFQGVPHELVAIFFGSWTPHKGIMLKIPWKNTTFLGYTFSLPTILARKKKHKHQSHNPAETLLHLRNVDTSDPQAWWIKRPQGLLISSIFPCKKVTPNQVEEMSRWQVTSLVKRMNILDTLQICWCTCPKT